MNARTTEKPVEANKELKQKLASAIFAAVAIATGELTLVNPTPVLANHRNVGDGECSWFPDRLSGVYDFHEACTNHDACGERAGSDKLAWDRCDRQLRQDTISWCENNNPTKRCRGAANTIYWGLRGFVNGTGIHRD